MEIIKEGKIPVPEKKRKFTCVYCGTVFKANKGEYEQIPHDPLAYAHDNLTFMCNCPMCGRLVFLKESR